MPGCIKDSKIGPGKLLISDNPIQRVRDYKQVAGRLSGLPQGEWGKE